jgi:phosphoglycolate phosphatase
MHERTTRYRLLVFDWDGTLADSTALIAGAIQQACRDLGLPAPDEASARHVIGLGHRDAISLVAPQLATSDVARFSERYRYHYLIGDADIPLFAGVIDMLDELERRGHLLAVATGKSRAGLARALARHGVRHRFVASRCADETSPKPHPAMLLALMDLAGASSDETLMIGDTTHDLELARNAGIDAVAVSYGAHPARGLAAMMPLALVHSLKELRSWLAKNA